MKYLILYPILVILLSACSSDPTTSMMCSEQQNIPFTNGKPAILVIGDSISIGYTPTMQSALTNYDVIHNPCNAMSSAWTITQIDTWLSGRKEFYSITWNNGLWDIASWHPISDSDYINNLHNIARKIKTKTTRPLFVLTTQVLSGTPDRIDSDVLHKNTLAQTVMAEEGIPVLDLYSVSATIPQDHINPYNVHYTAAGYKILGKAVLNELNSLYGVN